ncbi:membrane-targeted effector domain-containing toxin [Pseudomonas yamanorum]|uniref:membrane-targeted effector domain-containing toxin n=1 Tax=Pseudomonas yamanorum TaxID=515393 RepID=UPI003D35E4E8
MQDAPKQPNAAEAVALKALVPAMVETCPDLYEMATRFARKILTDHAINLDPEQIYFHRFHSSQSNDQTFTGWEHFEHPHDSLTLTQLVITRFTVHDQDNADVLDNDCGFYTAGPEVGTYNQSNEVRLLGSQVMKAFWAFNFLDHYKTAVATFWSSQSEHFRSLAKCTYLAKAIEDREAGRLSDAHFLTVVKAAASNVEWPVTRAMLDASIQPSPALRIRRLQIGSYVSSDILCIVDAYERQIVYVPGELWGFHVMESVVDLHWWVMSQVERPDARKRFMAHFQAMDHDVMEDTAALTSTQEWLLAAFPVADLLAHVFHEPHRENVGLSHLLDLLFSAWQTNNHQLLEVQQAWVNDDPFTHLRHTTHARMLADAGFMMHTNGELRKKLWMGYLNAFGRVFGPMAAVDWPVALAVVGAGIANVGLNIDQAVTGNTPAERKAGVTGAILAGIDTLFNAMFLKGGGDLPDIALTEETVGSETRLGTGTLSRADAPMLSDIAPDRVVAPAQQETLLDSLRTDITEGTRAGTGAREGIIETLSGKTYIYLRQGTTSGYFQVRYVKEVKGWLIIDAQNPYAFSRNVPVRLNAYKRWEPLPAPGLKGGMLRMGPKPWGRATDPLPQVDPVTTAYDVPVAERPALRDHADGYGDRHALSETYFAGNEYDDFKALRRRLYNDAKDFFAARPPTVRAPIPTFKPGTSIKEFIQRLLNEGPGIVFGENHSSVGSKRLLIENMPLLAKQKVKTLYLEHVQTDFHQADLELFNRSGKMPERLERYLNSLDNGFGTDPTGRYTFLEVVKSAQRNHIRVQAIDCMASYRKGLADVETFYRQQMMNFFARTVIDADQAARGAHKWVALVGNSHANVHQGVPGLGELEDVVGVRIEDVETGQPRGIEPDPGYAATDKRLTSVEIKNDLRVQMDTPLDVRVAQQLSRYLPEAGMYIHHVEPGYPMFVARGRDGFINCVLIQHDKAGYLVDRPEWKSVSGKHFKTLEELSRALKSRGMVEVTGPRLSPELPSSPVPASYASNLLLESESVNTQPGRFFQTYTLHSSGSLPNHAILMNGVAYHVRFETAINGPGHLAIVDPLNPDGFNTSLPVRLNARNEWELVDSPGLKGGGENQSKPAVSIASPAATAGPSSSVRPQPFSAYGISPEVLADHRV